MSNGKNTNSDTEPSVKKERTLFLRYPVTQRIGDNFVNRFRHMTLEQFVSSDECQNGTHKITLYFEGTLADRKAAREQWEEKAKDLNVGYQIEHDPESFQTNYGITFYKKRTRGFDNIKRVAIHHRWIEKKMAEARQEREKANSRRVWPRIQSWLYFGIRQAAIIMVVVAMSLGVALALQNKALPPYPELVNSASTGFLGLFRALIKGGLLLPDNYI